MPLHALENLADALEATRTFLWPIDRSRWVKLALVVFFVGGPGANLNLFQYNFPADRGPQPGGIPSLPEIGPRTWFLVGTVVAAVLVIGLLFLLVGSIMEFVLIESLRREEVAVRQYWSRRWRQGVRLFGFRLLLGVLVLTGTAVLVGLFFLPAIDVGPAIGILSGTLPIAVFLLLMPVIVVLAVLVGLFNAFTTVFVVPIMVLTDRGVLAGWRRLWPTITAHPWQYLAYALAGFVLTIAGGILVAIVVGVAVLVLLIPFGVLGAIGFFLLETVSPLGVGVLAITGFLFGLAVLAVVALAQVPVTTYLRYYALFVLGDIDEELDLIPERRETVRLSED